MTREEIRKEYLRILEDDSSGLNAPARLNAATEFVRRIEVNQEAANYATAGGRQADMTLRDWFAGQALSAIPFDVLRPISKLGETIPERMAEAAYLVADAMLKAREDKP